MATALKEGVSSSASPKHTDLGRPPTAQATFDPQPSVAISPAPLPLGMSKSNIVKGVIADPSWYLVLSKILCKLQLQMMCEVERCWSRGSLDFLSESSPGSRAKEGRVLSTGRREGSKGVPASTEKRNGITG